MPRQIAFIHTSAVMIPIFKALADELLGDAKIFNIVDDSLLRDIIRDGLLLPPTARRVVGHILAAEDAGADYIMVTCSSIGRATELAAKLASIPVLRVDEPMAQRAVEMGRRIGVAATLPSTLEPTAALIAAKAEAAGRKIELTSRLIEGAFEAVISGEGTRHDELVGETLKKLAKQVDVIVLAQASMARVVDALPPADRRVPVLSSLCLAVEHLAGMITKGRRS